MLTLYLISFHCKPYSDSENFHNIFSVNEQFTLNSMCKISKFSNKYMSQLSFCSHHPEMESLLPFPKILLNLAHPLSFHYLMAAEGSTVTSHQVIESFIEKGKTQTVYIARTKHKQNNCFSRICKKKKKVLFIPIIYTYLSFYNCILLGLGSQKKY